MKCKWVSQLQDDFQVGLLKHLAFPINVLAGGGPQEQGNHWIGTVIDLEASTIAIGDSLGNPANSTIVKMLKWFVKHISPVKFSIRKLLTHIQPALLDLLPPCAQPQVTSVVSSSPPLATSSSWILADLLM